MPVLFLVGNQKTYHQRQKKCSDHNLLVVKTLAKHVGMDQSPSTLQLCFPPSFPHHPLPPQHSCPLPDSAIFNYQKFIKYTVLFHCSCLENALLFVLPQLFNFLYPFVHLFNNISFLLTTSLVTGTLLGTGFLKINRTQFLFSGSLHSNQEDL